MQMPDRKIWAGGLGGAVAAIVIAALNAYVFDGAIAGEVYAALTLVITALVGYMVPSAKGEGDTA